MFRDVCNDDVHRASSAKQFRSTNLEGSLKKVRSYFSNETKPREKSSTVNL